MKVKRNQGGFIVSIELMFIATILVIGLLAGWVMIRDNTLGELQDVANAIGNVNQSYHYNGVEEVGANTGSGGTAINGPAAGPEDTYTSGSKWADEQDASDQYLIQVNVLPVDETDGWGGN